MLLPVTVLAASAAEESLKICELEYLGLGMYGSPTVFTLHLYLHILYYFYMEVFLLFLYLLDSFFFSSSSKELAFFLPSSSDFG
jgi:hypothetical protein